MSVVRLLGFATLGCGCVVGRYRDVNTSREVTYVEEKGPGCQSHQHRRNHTVTVGGSPWQSPWRRPRPHKATRSPIERLAVSACRNCAAVEA